MVRRNTIFSPIKCQQEQGELVKQFLIKKKSIIKDK